MWAGDACCIDRQRIRSPGNFRSGRDGDGLLRERGSATLPPFRGPEVCLSLQALQRLGYHLTKAQAGELRVAESHACRSTSITQARHGLLETPRFFLGLDASGGLTYDWREE